MPIRPQLRRPLWIAYILLGLWLAAVIPNRSAQARPVRQFTYADLVAESDVVVIATALSTDADKDREFDEEMRGDEEEVECVITSFRVNGIINGNVKGERLSVVHYRFKPEQRPIVNAPQLVRFENEGQVNGEDKRTGKPLRAPPPEYLLFLKATKDGKFVPTTGQTDPDGSVRRMTGADRDRQERVKFLGK
jgi:hypothetical protein